MANVTIDLKSFGLEAAQQAFDKLPLKVQKKVVRPVLRETIKRAQALVVAAVPVGAGNLKREMGRVKVTTDKAKRGAVRFVVPMPDRASLGIPHDAKGYYPAAIEYRPGGSYIRATIDHHSDALNKMMAIGIAKGIERQARVTK